MKFFIDTANLDEIMEAASLGILDGVTTNPSLIAKEGITGREAFKKHVKTICEAVQAPVSAEAVSTMAGDLIAEARSLADIDPHVVVKVPMTTDGLKAVKQLSLEGIKTNVTLVFSPLQALMAAKAGASYVSPFVGRLDDIAHDGMELVKQIIDVYSNYLFETEVIVASIPQSQSRAFSSATRCGYRHYSLQGHCSIGTTSSDRPRNRQFYEGLEESRTINRMAGTSRVYENEELL